MTTQNEIAVLEKQCEIMRRKAAADFAMTPVGQMIEQNKALEQIGKMYAGSSLVPDVYRNNLANCAIAVDMALRMKANPLMVMQNLYIVYGNPSWSSKFLVATVNTCGRYKTLKYRFHEDGFIGKVDYWENEETYVNGRKEKKSVKKTFDGSKIKNIVCVAYTSEINSDDILESAEVSCRMAVEEGWWTKKQSKWPNMTQQMLMYRADSYWVRAYAPELSMGFNTEYESLDMGPQRPQVEDISYEDLSHTVAEEKKSISELAREAAFNEAKSKKETSDPDGKQQQDGGTEIGAEKKKPAQRTVAEQTADAAEYQRQKAAETERRFASGTGSSMFDGAEMPENSQVITEE